MHKIMSLDIGTKRIGVALSDYLHISASGCCCLDRKPENAAVEKIKEIAQQNNVEQIVVGIPVNMDGTLGFQAQDCIDFSKLLGEDFEIIKEDERLTSSQAEENLKKRKINFRKNKSLVDIESACIILEQYIAKL